MRIINVEIIMQDTIIQEELYPVILQRETMVDGVRLVPFNIHVPSGFLLDQEFEICSHQVDTAFQSQRLADE